MTEQDIAARRKRDLERYYRQTAERRAQSLCIKCGRRPPTPHRTWCEPCAAECVDYSSILHLCCSDRKRRAITLVES